MRSFLLLFPMMLVLLSADCQRPAEAMDTSKKMEKVSRDKLSDYSNAVFASGCFWCVEAVFESVEGVVEAVSGYSGGSASTANYNVVSSGESKHAEAVVVYYDKAIISYETLLKVFFGSHDPTTLNRQGPDAGTQYRSAIFYQTEAEKMAIDKYIETLKAENVFEGTITTEITPLVAFFEAEDYHQDFERKNPTQGYVVAVSVPRLKRFQKKYPELLKKGH